MDWYGRNFPKPQPEPIKTDTPDFKEFNKEGVFRKHMKNRACLSAENLFSILPGSTFGGAIKKYGDKKNLPISNFNKLTLTMKLAVSRFKYKERWVGE